MELCLLWLRIVEHWWGCVFTVVSHTKRRRTLLAPDLNTLAVCARKTRSQEAKRTKRTQRKLFLPWWGWWVGGRLGFHQWGAWSGFIGPVCSALSSIHRWLLLLLQSDAPLPSVHLLFNFYPFLKLYKVFPLLTFSVSLLFSVTLSSFLFSFHLHLLSSNLAMQMS